MGSTEPSLKDIFEAIKNIGADLAELKKESKDNHCALTADIQRIDERFNDYKTVSDSRLDNCELNISHLAYEMESMKQRQIKCNASISGVPVTNGENLLDIFNKICNAINYNCTNDNISGIYRTNGRNKQSIIVQFTNENTKFGILNAKKLKKSLIVEELNLNFNNASNEIMINQQLTPYFGNLLYNARQAKSNGHIAECWFTMRGVHIKPTKTSNAVIIKSVGELNTFFSTDEPILSAAKPTSTETANKRKASHEIPNEPKKTNDASAPNNNNSDKSKQAQRNNQKGTTPNTNQALVNTASASGTQTTIGEKIKSRIKS